MPINAIIFISLKWRQTSKKKIFRQKMRAMRCQYKVKIDIDAAVSFLLKKEDQSRWRPFPKLILQSDEVHVFLS